jgi:hypothetical protein
MASTCSQPITHSYPHASTIKPSFQFSKPPSSSDASIFGCAARFNLSAMDVPASIDGRRFQAPPAVGQPLPPACAAELSEDGEISDSDDDSLPSFKKILARPKQVIDLTHDGDEGDEDDITKVSWLRNTRTAQHRVRLTSPSLTDHFRVVDQLPLPPHRPLCQNHLHTPTTTSQRRLQRPHLAKRNTLGRMSLRGPHYTVNFNSVPTLMRCTPARRALGRPQPRSSLRRRTSGL